MGDYSTSMDTDFDNENHERFVQQARRKVQRMANDESEIADIYTSQSGDALHVYITLDVEAYLGISPHTGAVVRCVEILPLPDEKLRFLYTYDLEGEGR